MPPPVGAHRYAGEELGSQRGRQSRSASIADDYLAAYEQVFERASAPWAPWYVVPADPKWFARIAVAGIIANKLIEMDPQFPAVDEKGKQAMLACRETLAGECGDGAPAASVPEKLASAAAARPDVKKAKKKSKKKSRPRQTGVVVRTGRPPGRPSPTPHQRVLRTLCQL